MLAAWEPRETGGSE